MILYIKGESGKVETSFFFLHGERIVLQLSVDGALSDQGQAYDAVGLMTSASRPIADVLEKCAVEIAPRLGVEYRYGVFFLESVTEGTLQELVIRLANAMLLFYGIVVGLCRAFGVVEEASEE